MKYTSEFRERQAAEQLSRKIHHLMDNIGRKITLMEVCGTHTMVIFRYGIRDLLPDELQLLSGPGCPVCVTPNLYLDKAIIYSSKNNVIITTFGDMLRVPGSKSSLAQESSRGAQIKVVYSSLESLRIAEENPEKEIIFLAVGFETTAPTIAASILMAEERELSNYFVLCAHKLIPPAMQALAEMGELRVDGFLCPGHVSTIIGSEVYQFLCQDYGIPCVVAGFEPLDVLQTIYLLLSQIKAGRAEVENEYRRVVSPQGNLRALELMQKVFEITDSPWRGLGKIKNSGLRIRDTYARFDIERKWPLKIEEETSNPGCICGEILRGLNTPLDCPLFGKICHPDHPVGPCMVSQEGTCAAYYRYGNVGQL